MAPSWRSCAFRSYAEYLGYHLGPGKGERSWAKAIRKFEERARGWKDAGAGLYYTILYYNVSIFSVLTFVAQLEVPPKTFVEVERKALNKLIKGPGGWMDPEDLKTLKRG